MLIDIIIPIGPYHKAVAENAIESARNQTIPVTVTPYHDEQGLGAGAARNNAVAQTRSHFLVFLDADDTLSPDFCEKTLRQWLKAPERYVYTDFLLENGGLKYCDEDRDIFTYGLGHHNTTLLPRKAFIRVGGYDASLRTLEDEDLYARLHLLGVCGQRVAEPLMRYNRDMGRSLVSPFAEDASRRIALENANKRFARLYGQYRSLNMCKCTSRKAEPVVNPAVKQHEGDIQVQALYSPMHQIGPVTKRKYPRAGLGETLYVHPDDVAAKPQWWRPTVAQAEIAPDVDTVLRLAGF